MPQTVHTLQTLLRRRARAEDRRLSAQGESLAEYDAVQEGVELGYLCLRDGTPCDFQDYPYEYGADADGNRGEMRVERRCSKCGEYPGAIDGNR